MRLLEYQGKELFDQYGIRIPRSQLANNIVEAREGAKKIGIPLVPSKSWPPLPGVTPAATFVPYAFISRECVEPKLPVMPWMTTGFFL